MGFAVWVRALRVAVGVSVGDAVGAGDGVGEILELGESVPL